MKSKKRRKNITRRTPTERHLKVKKCSTGKEGDGRERKKSAELKKGSLEKSARRKKKPKRKRGKEKASPKQLKAGLQPRRKKTSEKGKKTKNSRGSGKSAGQGRGESLQKGNHQRNRLDGNTKKPKKGGTEPRKTRQAPATPVASLGNRSPRQI